MSGFTHFNEDGNAVMVDVGEKAETKREALASGVIRMSEECFQKVKEGSMKKGDVLGVARIAGIMGAKKTAELIPLCHLLNLTKVEIDFEYLEEEHVRSCSQNGIGVNVWTVNEEEDMRRMKKWGVNSIITNYPDRGRAVADED